MSVYVPTVWRNLSEPYINAANLNHMELGIESAHAEIQVNSDKIDTNTSNISINSGKIQDNTDAIQDIIDGIAGITLPKATETVYGVTKIWVSGTDGFIDARP